MYKWFLASRYLRTKLIAFFGIASVMFCSAMVLVVLSVMGGFLDTVRDRARGLHSEIILNGFSLQGFPYYEEFGRYLMKELPDLIEITTPAIYTYGIFRVPATKLTKPAQVMGVRLDEYVKVNEFKEGLYYDRYYPGSTHLGEQLMPVEGVTGDGELALPEDLVRANQKWLDGEKSAKERQRFMDELYQRSYFPDIVPFRPGERVYASDEGPPRYVGPSYPGVIVGCDVLHYRRSDGRFDRHIARGAQVALMLMPLSAEGNVRAEGPIRMALRYADDSQTGIFEIDKQSVYVDFDLLQAKLAMDPQTRVDGSITRARANQLFIDVKPGNDLNEARERIAIAWSAFPGSLEQEPLLEELIQMRQTEVLTWEDMQRTFIAAVEKEKVLVTFLFALISMVAMVLIGCIFYMIVEKKTRDIGVLKSLGASGRGVAGLFIFYAAAVGLAGAALGTGFGAMVVWYINDIQDFLASLNPQLRVWSPDIYSFDKIPNVVKSADAIWVGSIAIASSMLGSVIPATMAARVWPVQALRYE